MSIEWYHDLMREDDEGNEDFEGCPSCLGGDIELISNVINSFGHREKSFKCKDCGQRWQEVDMPDFTGD